MGDFPSLVSIQKKKFGKNEHFCAGTIIDELHILTAAHCLFTYNKGPRLPIDYEVMAGDVSISRFVYDSHRAFYKPVLIFVHTQYIETTQDNDVAVIRVSKPIEFIENIVAPAQLSKQKVNSETVCQVAGWGFLAETRKEIVPNQQKIYVPIVRDALCYRSYSRLFRSDLKFCAGFLSGGIDACVGDSGGGLFCSNDTVHGIVSFGIGCARSFYPGMYTNVTTYRNWINSCLEFNGTQEQIPMPKWEHKDEKPSKAAALVECTSWIFVQIAITFLDNCLIV